MPNIKTYGNQRVVKINKAICNSTHLYSTNNIQALDYAMGKLSTIGAVKLYLYLAKNQTTHTRALSSKDFCEWANCSRTCYDNAFKELKDNGFLVLVDEDKKNYFEFRDWGNCNITVNEAIKAETVKGEGFDF